MPTFDIPSDCPLRLALQSRHRPTALVLSLSLLSPARPYTHRGKHNVNEHINVIHPHLRRDAVLSCRSIEPNAALE